MALVVFFSLLVHQRPKLIDTKTFKSGKVVLHYSKAAA